MKKILFVWLLVLSTLWAKTDFSEMSTEELIALIGYIDPSKEERLYEELDTRLDQMSETQKALYEEDKKRRDNAQN
ncbi:hypothetical protein [Sulfurospirillum arsenophilum]|uniref:hypothetical protein n=1 Tax=Sulfurospirillum arsenophilum TaxID=56698 RepID=UPI0005AA9DF9|nr:hypothetical protein [Sulfurospirillum arsenophilum]